MGRGSLGKSDKGPKTFLCLIWPWIRQLGCEGAEIRWSMDLLILEGPFCKPREWGMRYVQIQDLSLRHIQAHVPRA